MLEQHRHLANKYEDIVNLHGAGAYRGGRPPTAFSYYSVCLQVKPTLQAYSMCVRGSL